MEAQKIDKKVLMSAISNLDNLDEQLNEITTVIGTIRQELYKTQFEIYRVLDTEDLKLEEGRKEYERCTTSGPPSAEYDGL